MVTLVPITTTHLHTEYNNHTLDYAILLKVMAILVQLNTLYNPL